MGDLDTLTEQVMALDRDERASLIARLEFEQTKAQAQPSRQDLTVWAALAPYARHRSLPEFLRDKAGGATRAAYTAAVTALYELTERAAPVRHPGQDAQALIEVALECLAGELTGRGHAATARNLIAGIDRLRPAVNRCYPGYLEAGLLHKLIRVYEPAA